MELKETNGGLLTLQFKVAPPRDSGAIKASFTSLCTCTECNNIVTKLPQQNLYENPEISTCMLTIADMLAMRNDRAKYLITYQNYHVLAIM